MEILRYDLLVGNTGVRMCWIFRASMRERTSSLPVALNSLKTFSVSLPACKVLCPSPSENFAVRMLSRLEQIQNKWDRADRWEERRSKLGLS